MHNFSDCNQASKCVVLKPNSTAGNATTSLGQIRPLITKSTAGLWREASLHWYVLFLVLTHNTGLFPLHSAKSRTKMGTVARKCHKTSLVGALCPGILRLKVCTEPQYYYQEWRSGSVTRDCHGQRFKVFYMHQWKLNLCARLETQNWVFCCRLLQQIKVACSPSPGRAAADKAPHLEEEGTSYTESKNRCENIEKEYICNYR